MPINVVEPGRQGSSTSGLSDRAMFRPHTVQCRFYLCLNRLPYINRFPSQLHRGPAERFYSYAGNVVFLDSGLAPDNAGLSGYPGGVIRMGLFRLVSGICCITSARTRYQTTLACSSCDCPILPRTAPYCPFHASGIALIGFLYDTLRLDNISLSSCGREPAGSRNRCGYLPIWMLLQIDSHPGNPGRPACSDPCRSSPEHYTGWLTG